MNHVTFVTSNDVKFDSAQHLAAKLGFSLDRAQLDFDEMQAEGEIIARQKAQQAYDVLRKPIVITDDTWDIPGLRGFPGSYMKQMNEWFTPEDWLRLTVSLADRHVILRQHAVYQDAAGQHYFVDDIVGTLLNDIRGQHKHPFLTLTSFDNGKRSRAEALALGEPLLNETMQTVWHQLANWLASQPVE